MLELKSGTELKSRYVVQGVVGSGGYATVWRASDKQLNREVALKRLLKPFHSHSEADVAALLQEATNGAQLVHTNIVQVHDIIEAEGEHLIVMEFVDGQSLETLLRDRALRGQTIPLDTGMAYLKEILTGVAFAHSKQICHRDLSPANIFLSVGGTPKIGDFGIAKVMRLIAPEASPGVSQPQGGTGNANYMSPEQARGEPADFASDLFMVGITGYLILTGQHPFAHPSGLFTIPELLLREEFVPPAPKPDASLPSSQQRLFREYAAVIMRLLQREKAGRFASAIDAIDAIDSVTPTQDCPVCEERIPEHHSFCGYCGTPLKAKEAKAEGVAIASATPGASTAEDLIDEGYRLSLEKNWSAAIDRYNQAIQLESNNNKAYRNLAFVLNRAARHDEAIRSVNTGLDLGQPLPRHRASMLYERGVAYVSLKKYEEAFHDIQEGLELQPNSTKLLYSRARVQEFRGNFEEAKRDATVLLRRVPDHAGALRLLDQYG